MPLSLAFQNLPPQMRATILMIVALFMFTCMGIFIRLSAADLPVIEVVFFRNALAVVLLVPLIMRVGWSSMRMQKPKLFFLRAVINFGGMFCGFTALTLIPLAQMTALSFTGPLFVTIGAVLFLGEIIRARRIAAIAVGFLGTLIILQPGFTEISVGATDGACQHLINCDGVADREKTNHNRNTRSHCDMDGGNASAFGIDTGAWCLAMAKP